MCVKVFKSVRIMLNITIEKALDFYKLTEKKLNDMAIRRGIKDLKRYYSLTDFDRSTRLGKLLSNLGDNSLSQVFAQMAFHAQNATLISNIVSFNSNIELLKAKLCNFDPKSLKKEYQNAMDIVEALRYNEDNNVCGLKWNSEKSRFGKRDSLMAGYAQALLDCAEYLCHFKDGNEVYNDLNVYGYIGNTDEEKTCNLIKYFQEKIPHRFSIALTCDFLKEFRKEFSFLCKPDVHIKDVLCALFGNKKGFYNTMRREYECVLEMQELVKCINAALSSNERITVYKLDRMIWLICSDKFFLDNTESAKESFLKSIKDLKS